jgi:hypothetical protein
LVFALACFASLLYGQSSTVTNNNTTTIQGDVYVNMPKGLGW